MGTTLNTMRHVLLEVTEEYGRLKRENESLKAEVERLKRS
jgi:cell division protein FtsB